MQSMQKVIIMIRKRKKRKICNLDGVEFTRVKIEERKRVENRTSIVNVFAVVMRTEIITDTLIIIN